MDDIFTLSENYTISLPLKLLKRLDYASGQGSKEIFLSYEKKGHKTYVLINTSINFKNGYACISNIVNGEIIIPKNFLLALTPGHKFKLKEKLSSLPLWLEVLN